MFDCGETIPSIHPCGNCGEDGFGIADLEKLAADFDATDWPNCSAGVFVEWLKMLPVLDIDTGPGLVIHEGAVTLVIDDSEEEDDDSLAS